MTERMLLKAMQALEPASARLVVVGGTAHRLFTMHALGKEPGFELLTTMDVDFAAPLDIGYRGTRTLVERLERAGFEEKVAGAEEPAYTYPMRDGEGEYLQFIAQRTGSGKRRDGTRDRLLRFSGIHSEKLPHVNLLLYQPWTVELPEGEACVTLQVVNPIAYLLQKLLVLKDRNDSAKKGKDLLYVYDTLTIFAESLTELGTKAAGLAPELSKRQERTIRNTATECCFKETDVSRMAAHIANESQRKRSPDSSQITAACHVYLPRLLGTLITDL